MLAKRWNMTRSGAVARLASLEKGRVTLGAERAEKLARALKVHPAVLLWPNWDESEAKRVGGS